MSEKPVHSRLRRLVDWINLTGAKKVHSLIDKVYKRKNLEMAWEKVKANRGSGGVDGQTLEAFEAQLNQQLERLQRELKEDSYQPLPVRQHPIPKRDKPGEYRMLGIPAIYDRVCQQALLNRLEPIFEPLFDDASFGYLFWLFFEASRGSTVLRVLFFWIPTLVVSALGFSIVAMYAYLFTISRHQ